MGYHQHTIPENVAVEPTFVAFRQHSQTYVHLFEELLTQNHPQYLPGLSRALFPTTFLEIALLQPSPRRMQQPKKSWNFQIELNLDHETWRRETISIDRKIVIDFCPMNNPMQRLTRRVTQLKICLYRFVQTDGLLCLRFINPNNWIMLKVNDRLI